MTEELQRKRTEKEVRLALLAFLANKDTPLGHIRHIVQPHLRENPPAINRGESYVMNVPINELITRFKIACKMLGSQDKREKTHPPKNIQLKHKTYKGNNQLQKNIAKTPCKSHPTPQIPPLKERKNVTI